MAGFATAPRGFWPVMLTPFDDERSVDWPALDALTDWYIDSGAAGLFSVCLSSAMYDLSEDERLAVARAVVKRAAGRAPVVASGTFGGSAGHQAGFARRMADTGVDAVVVLTSQMAREDEPDLVWRERAEQFMALLRDIPLGLYECPVPYKRLLSLDVMRWASGTGRFLFLKDTSCQIELIRARCAATRGTRLALFNANAPTLLPSLQAGAAGFCGVAGNFFPRLVSRLCAHYADRPEESRRLQQFISVADMVVRSKYPWSAKRFLALRGLALRPVCRAASASWVEEDEHVLRDLLAMVEEWEAGYPV